MTTVKHVLLASKREKEFVLVGTTQMVLFQIFNNVSLIQIFQAALLSI